MSIAALLEAADFLERREREAEHGYASILPLCSPRDLSKNDLSYESQMHLQCEPELQFHLQLDDDDDISNVPVKPQSNAYSAHYEYHPPYLQPPPHTKPQLQSDCDFEFQQMRKSKSKKSYSCSRSTHNELEKNRRAHLRQCLEKLKEMVPLGPESPKHTTLGLLTKAKRFIKSLEERERKIAIQKEQLSRENRILLRKLEQLSVQNSITKRRSISESSTSTVSSTNSSFSLGTSPFSISESDEVDMIGYCSNQSDSDDLLSVQSGSSDSGVVMSTSRLTLSESDVY